MIENPILPDLTASRSYNQPFVSLFNEDCRETMANRIESRCVDLILTDLPYGTTACAWDEIIPIEPMWKEFYRILRPNGTIVLTSSQPFTTKLIHSNIRNFSHQWIWEKIGSNGNPLLADKMPLKNFEDVLVFTKNGYDEELKHPLRFYTNKIREYTGYSRTKFNKIFGHYKFQHFLELQQQYSICTEDVYNELTEYFGLKEMDGYLDYAELLKIEYNLPKRTYNPQMTEGKSYTITSGEMGEAFGGKNGGYTTISEGDRYPKSILRFGYDKEKLHPTQKPLSLMRYLVLTYSNKGDTVYDGCSGSGTTAHACLKEGRKFIGSELDETYFKKSVQRLKNVPTELF